MKRRLVPLIILILLVVVYLAVQQKESAEISSGKAENYIDIDTAAVTKVSISKLGSQTVLSKVEGKWYLLGEESRRADPQAVASLFEALEGLTVGTVVSENPENQMKFQVDTLTGSTVRIFEEGELASAIVVGKMSQDFSHTYVRKTGSNNVRLAEGMLTYMVGRQRDAWLDKTIFDIPSAAVESVKFTYRNEDYTALKGDTLWLITRPPYSDTLAADQQVMSELLGHLCMLKADRFATPNDSAKYNFDNLVYVAEVSLENGASHVLQAAETEQDASAHFVKTGTDETVYILNNPTWQQIVKSYDELVSAEKSS